VTVYSDKSLSSEAAWYKFDARKQWYDYSDHATFVDNRTIVLELEDGGFGDADGIRNGVIYEPGGPSLYIPPEPEPTPDPADYLSPASNCFIRSLRQ